MPFIKYSDDNKAGILATIIVYGFPNRRGSCQYAKAVTGVRDIRTLYRWYYNVDLGLIENKIMELEKLIEKELSLIFGEMNEKRPNATYKDLSTAAGILSDKLITIQGGVNSRTETIHKDWKQAVLDARAEKEQK